VTPDTLQGAREARDGTGSAMPGTREQRLRVLIRASLPWRKLFGNRTVLRTVQGVELYMPWSHLLPDYARARPTYGQNLIEVADALTRHAPSNAGPLRMLDIGANIGDSALQVLGRVDARVLCVEADPYWMRFLRLNADGDQRIVIEEALLVANDAADGGALAPVRQMGTTRFAPVASGDGTPPRLSVQALRERHPEFRDIRLIKSDTDGFDAALVPAVAREWSASSPVLFFEFDPGLTRKVGNDDPHRLWEELASCGYTRFAIWDNTGDPLGRLTIDEVATHAAALEPRPVELGYQFWDVAACRDDDDAAIAALDQTMPESFDPRGHRINRAQ
jgi:FkbM family methyltransferase